MFSVISIQRIMGWIVFVMWGTLVTETSVNDVMQLVENVQPPEQKTVSPALISVTSLRTDTV